MPDKERDKDPGGHDATVAKLRRAADLHVAFLRAGLAVTVRRPTRRQIDAALDVLAWLSEQSDSGADRDEIGHVRHLLAEADR